MYVFWKTISRNQERTWYNFSICNTIIILPPSSSLIGGLVNNVEVGTVSLNDNVPAYIQNNNHSFMYIVNKHTWQLLQEGLGRVAQESTTGEL